MYGLNLLFQEEIINIQILSGIGHILAVLIITQEQKEHALYKLKNKTWQNEC